MADDLPAHEAMLALLRGIGEAADARQREIRGQRRLPDDLAQRLVDSSVYRTWVSPVYGGRGGSAQDLFDAIETLAWWDGATAWYAMVSGTAALVSGFLPADGAREIFGDPRTQTGGYSNPMGRGRMLDGGIRVSGRWGWGSATRHCNWILGGVSLGSGDETGSPRSGGVRTPLCFFPRAAVTLHDNWHTLGLEGTASVDYEVHDLVVPDRHWVSFPMTSPVVDEPLYRFSTIGALAAGVAWVAIGMARRAIDELVKLATHKVPAGGARPLAERALIQTQLIECEAAWLSAREVLREQTRRCWDQAVGQGEIAPEARRLLRVACINAVERCSRAVDLCYAAGGGSSIHDTSPLQRMFRDMHVATQHGINGPLFMERLGKLALGLSSDTSLL
jgi:indole-3-acetate monooxygenase